MSRKKKETAEMPEEINTGTPAEEPAEDAPALKVGIVIGVADVRVEADGMSPIFATLEEGTEVPVIQMIGDWYEVIVGEEIGYIYKDSLSVPADEVAEETAEEAEVPEEEIPEDAEAPEEEPAEEIIPEVEKKVTIFTSRRTVMTEGEPVYLTSKLEGFEGCEILYQWQCDCGEGFEDVEGANSDTYEFAASAETLSWGWQLIVYYR